jgi:hypothetical protein
MADGRQVVYGLHGNAQNAASRNDYLVKVLEAQPAHPRVVRAET